MDAAALLLFIVLSPAARADLYGAVSAYEKQEFPAAFEQFTALAELGQPVAQLDLAKMYGLGQGTSQSDIYAYAWASLAAQNGEAEGRKIADDIHPRLAPGSERIAGWITEPYTSEALSRSLLPELQTQKAAQMAGEDEQAKQCKWVKATPQALPVAATMNREEREVDAGCAEEAIGVVDDIEYGRNDEGAGDDADRAPACADSGYCTTILIRLCPPSRL